VHKVTNPSQPSYPPKLLSWARLSLLQDHKSLIDLTQAHATRKKVKVKGTGGENNAQPN
jgi:hypothetical protein